MALERVLSPLKIGGIEIKNRVARTAHGIGTGRFGVSDDFIAYHVERARGGLGLNILEAGTVHRSSHLDFPIHTDDASEGLKRLVDAVHPFGMKLFQQLWHGGNLYPSADGSPPLAVSTRPGFTGIVGRPMTKGEIEGIIEGFAATAVRCKNAGIDGVELHATHGYIFHQFLSLATNTREDEYGGSIENRLRFLMETARAVRAAVGPDFPIGVRVGASAAPDTIDEEMAATMVVALCGEKLVDYVNGSWGDYYYLEKIIGAMHRPMAYELPSVSQVIKDANVPRLVTGRVRTLEEADSLIRDGQAEIVSMVRAMIADPYLVAKTEAGNADQVRPCIACNQGCSGGMARTGRVGCTVNAAAGFEHTLSEHLIQPAAGQRKVLIVGGGPAGMEAARVAATMGHKVVLCEAQPDLGGTVNIAKRAPRLHTIGDAIWWLEQELQRLGVEVRLNAYVEADEALAEAADVIIVATGSLPRMDGYQLHAPGEPASGVELPHVISSHDLIAGGKEPGSTALVLDTTGHIEAMAVLDQLLSHGVAVTYVTHAPQFMPYVESTLRVPAALERLSNGSVDILLRHQLVEITPDKKCLVRSIYGRKDQLVPAETVVLITQNEPMQDLFNELRDRHPDVRLVGDAAGPRDMQAAIADGHRCARTLV